MPNRLVREGFLDSEAIDKLSSDAECFYHRLLLVADDAGRVDGRAEILRSRVYPLRDSLRTKTIAGLIRECIESGLILAYDMLGKPFLQVTRWQRCGNGKTSRFPWSDGSYSIEYVTTETRDGPKDFVATSIPNIDPIRTPCQPGAPQLERPSPYSSPSKQEKIMTESSNGFDDFPESLRSDGFLATWKRWEQHRREIGHAIKATQRSAMIEKLAAMGLDRAIETINHTIAMGWQGLREPDQKSVGRQNGSIKNRSELDVIDFLRKNQQLPDGCYFGLDLTDKFAKVGFDGLTEPEQRIAIDKCRRALERVR